MFDVKLKECWLTEESKKLGVNEHILELLLRHSREQGRERNLRIQRTLSDAVMYGIEWDATPEGFVFWDTIFDGFHVMPTTTSDEMTMKATTFLLISKSLSSMAIIQRISYKQRWRILFSKLPRNLFELYCREHRKQNVQIKPTILVEDATSGRIAGGFEWWLSTLGEDFWHNIACHLIRKDEIDEDVLCVIKDTEKFIDFRKLR